MVDAAAVRMPLTQRALLEPAAGRYLAQISATLMPRALWGEKICNEIWAAIQSSDWRTTTGRQRTYRKGVQEPLARNQQPSWTSIQICKLHVLGKNELDWLRNKLELKGLAWMLREDVVFDETRDRQFIKDPDNPAMPWVARLPPTMPRDLKVQKFNQEGRQRPIYKTWANGDITVRHEFMGPRVHPATIEEMLACTDRIQLDQTNAVVYPPTIINNDGVLELINELHAPVKISKSEWANCALGPVSSRAGTGGDVAGLQLTRLRALVTVLLRRALGRRLFAPP